MCAPYRFALGQPLPLEIRLSFAEEAAACSGILVLDLNLILLKLDAPSAAEIESFHGRSTFRIGDFKSFMLVSLLFQGYYFDLLWSPVIARAQESGFGLAEIDPDAHMALKFVLIDEDLVVRGLRVGTISPGAGHYMAQLQRNLLMRDIDAEEVQRDMARVFTKYQYGIPGDAFQMKSRIGS